MSKELLPKSVGDRILLCVCCPFVMLVLLVFVYAVYLWKPETLLERVLWIACDEISAVSCAWASFGASLHPRGWRKRHGSRP